MPTTQDLLPELEAACQDLLWRSETDCPFEVTVWPLPPQDFSADALRDHGQYPASAPVVTLSLDIFFGKSTVERSWLDSREITLVRRYRNLRDLLETTLENLQVYVIGEVERDAYLLGTTEDGQIMGVKTQIVET